MLRDVGVNGTVGVGTWGLGIAVLKTGVFLEFSIGKRSLLELRDEGPEVSPGGEGEKEKEKKTQQNM